MSKISSAEQAAKECIEIWEKIEEICDDERNHYVSGIKNDIIGEKYYLNDCPLCEYYQDNLNECPLSAGEDNCWWGCCYYGFNKYMSRDEIKSFNRVLKEKLMV